MADILLNRTFTLWVWFAPRPLSGDGGANALPTKPLNSTSTPKPSRHAMTRHAVTPSIPHLVYSISRQPSPPTPCQNMQPHHLYTVSIHYDRRLYREDIRGSIAHALMLAKQGIITDDEAEAIRTGLLDIKQEIESETFPWRPELEDIHMNIESRLKEKIGPVAGKLHTARSRNDQVATDMRLFTMGVCEDALKSAASLQRALVQQAEKNAGTIMPGYTHLQRAQPVLLAHHFLAYFHMLQRDKQRFQQCRNAAAVLPLGSGALAGLPYPLDRQFVAEKLGFDSISSNSMDAVTDRDFLLDFHSAAATCMMHLSRLGEELVLWSSQEFAFVTLADQFTTGSSIMPQKRNPDFAEIGRGKTGRVYGNLFGLLTTLKGLPLTYNRDLQEDKEGCFDTVDTLLSTLQVFAGMIDTMNVNADTMHHAAQTGNMLATDLADYLVARGMPFREAHGVLRQASEYARENTKEVHQLTLEEYRQFSDLFDENVLKITLQGSIEGRNVPGGSAPNRVADALREAREVLEAENHA